MMPMIRKIARIGQLQGNDLYPVYWNEKGGCANTTLLQIPCDSLEGELCIIERDRQSCHWRLRGIVTGVEDTGESRAMRVYYECPYECP
jgi:hypothetical protein